LKILRGLVIESREPQNREKPVGIVDSATEKMAQLLGLMERAVDDAAAGERATRKRGWR
jgi:hypothetical protein